MAVEYEIVSGILVFKARVEDDGGTIVENTCIPYTTKERVKFDSLA